MRLYGPYLTVSQAITTGLIVCAGITPETIQRRRDALKCRSADADTYVKVAQWLLSRVSYLQGMLPLLESDAIGLALLGGFIDHHARQGRTSDIRTIKDNISKWIPTVKIPDACGEPGDMLTISPLHPETGIFDTQRANWGWNSTCFLEGLRNGKIKMNHTGFPSFLYDDSKGPISESPKDFLDGLFEGPMIIACYRCIWTSPESSTNAPGVSGTGRPSISRTYNVERVTGESIAYIACLLRHVLSSEATWYHQNPSVYNGAAFFENMCKLFAFEEVADPILAIMQWYEDSPFRPVLSTDIYFLVTYTAPGWMRPRSLMARRNSQWSATI
ncbi:hypothetical protein GY45DRAFT_1263587 [Cubamyces sp. BRFM 1775]|nr:hypothetical protein GY45DRAFT_1263587 [Cubamyces sp. BRFM 1775]